MSGQVSGLVTDVVSCKVLIERIVGTAQEQIQSLGRLCG